MLIHFLDMLKCKEHNRFVTEGMKALNNCVFTYVYLCVNEWLRVNAIIKYKTIPVSTCLMEHNVYILFA